MERGSGGVTAVLRLRLAVPEPAVVAARLAAALGTAVMVELDAGGEPSHVLRLPSATVELVTPSPDRLPLAVTSVDPWPSLGSGTSVGRPEPDLLGVGWATVDLERAVAELAAVRPGLGPPMPLPDDRLLGARAVGLGVLVLLEPAREGRLAASLARHGEGPAVLYLAAAVGGAATAADTPFGPGVLLAGPATGPHVVCCVPGARRRAAAPYHPGMLDRPTVNVRAATAADAARLAALLTDEGYPAGASDIEGRLERFASEFSQVRVADLDGEVLGFIALHVLPRFEHDDRIVRIVALVVDPGARERGVGHRLMEEAERIGRAVGAGFVEVTAGHHRPEARHLYEVVGYEAGVTTYLRKRL